MTTLTVQCGHETNTFTLDAGPTVWAQVWRPSDTGLDVRLFSRGMSGPGGHECLLRLGNTSVVPGDASKTKPRMQVDVSVEGAPDLRWPSDWPMGRATFRRFVVGGRDRGVDFRPDWRTAKKAYGPCNLPLPTLGAQQYVLIANAASASLNWIKSSMQLGLPFTVEDTQDGVLLPQGGWMPHGPSDPGAVGGTGIYFSTGWPQSKPDLQRAYLLMQTEADRMKWYEERTTGEPISTEHYPGQTPDVWGNGTIPEAMIADSGGDPLPMPYDFAHLIRGIRRSIQVAEQADCPMAKHHVRLIATQERLRFSSRGRLAAPGYTPMNLHELQAQADAAPSTGIFGSIAGRQIGWPMFVVAEDLKLNGVHGENLAEIKAFLHFIETATTPTGPIQKCKGGSGGWPINDFSCQSFEQDILAFAAAGCATQAGQPIPTFVPRTLESIYGATSQVPILMYGNQTGPPHYIRTAGDDGKPVTRLKDPLTTYGDPAHAEAACALMASIGDAKTWVDRGRFYSHAFPDVATKLAWLTSSGVTVLDWTCNWIAAAQAVTA